MIKSERQKSAVVLFAIQQNRFVYFEPVGNPAYQKILGFIPDVFTFQKYAQTPPHFSFIKIKS